jgi:hypothetical protein
MMKSNNQQLRQGTALRGQQDTYIIQQVFALGALRPWQHGEVLSGDGHLLTGRYTLLYADGQHASVGSPVDTTIPYSG